MKNNDHQYLVLMEYLSGQFQLLTEIVSSMQTDMKTLAKKDDVYKIVGELRSMRLALTSTNRDVRSHDMRLTKLEVAVFRRKAPT